LQATSLPPLTRFSGHKPSQEAKAEALQKRLTLQKIKERRTAETEFPLRWAHKDVQLALAAAGEERARLPILNQIDSIWAEAEPGFGADDLSAIYLALSNGVKQ
jgi:3-hydroxyisobutyrate dehydrogenase-like beta-hydroxyacid dehydrogenase